MRKNEWASRFGAKRRAIDRALLAECERALGATETWPGGLTLNSGHQTPAKPETASSQARNVIARAFGRPLH